MDRLAVNPKCLKCEGILEVSEDSPTDESVVRCKSCGHIFGTYGELKAKAVAAARQWRDDWVANKFPKG